MFGINQEKWQELNGYNTAKEISHQPELWKETLNIIETKKEEIDEFMEKYYNKNTQIIFSGAGTSAYVGEIIVPYLNKNIDGNFNVVASTDIVSSPEMYLKNTPTIMVHFARSGNSPESIASYDLGNQLIENISHVFITCNKDGKLAQISQGNKKVLLLLMPEESNDKGFAMTSSFSCMTIAATLLFDRDNFNKNKKELLKSIDISKNILNNGHMELKELLDGDFNRIVYLGSGSFYGLTKESALKLLELTRGQIISHSETILGFRHGPKSIVDNKTYIFVYISNDNYSKKYDMDLINEIYQDLGEHKLITISKEYDKDIKNISDYHIYLQNAGDINNEVFIGLLYVIYAQVFALLSSIKSEVEPDNPNPSGAVNRVVKGVRIYDYE